MEIFLLGFSLFLMLMSGRGWPIVSMSRIGNSLLSVTVSICLIWILTRKHSLYKSKMLNKIKNGSQLIRYGIVSILWIAGILIASDPRINGRRDAYSVVSSIFIILGLLIAKRK